MAFRPAQGFSSVGVIRWNTGKIPQKLEAAAGIERALVGGAMKMQNTGVQDRDEWRERIMRALKDLRGDDSATVGRMRRDDASDDAAADSAKF